MEWSRIKTKKIVLTIGGDTPIYVRIICIIIIGLSCGSFCALCSSRVYSSKQVLLGLMASFFVGSLIAQNKISSDKRVIFSYKDMGSILVALYLLRWIGTYTNKQTIQLMCDWINNHIGWLIPSSVTFSLLCVVALPFSIMVSRRAITIISHAIRSFYKSLDIIEKRFFIIVAFFGLLFTILIFILTTAFWSPTLKDGSVVNWDVIYTTDTGTLVVDDVFTNIGHNQNDIRQPLFAVFSMPVGLFAHFVSLFLPFMTIDQAYAFVLTLLQICMIAIIGVLITKMLKVSTNDKPYYLLVYSLCFPCILFGLVLEQYVITSFYVVLCVFFWITDEKQRPNMLIIAATGSMLTSGVLVTLCSKTKSLSKWLKSFVTVLLSGIAIIVVSGQLPILLSVKEQILSLIVRFGGANLSLCDRLYQYSHFVKNIIFAPYGVVVNNDYPTYRLSSYSSISIAGIIVLCIVFVGWVLNLTKPYASICMCWVLFSQVILVIIGWGSAENGMVLYTLYFAWAYISLVFGFLERVIKHKKAVLCVAAVLILIWNTGELIRVLSFAHAFYPIRLN